MFNLYKDKIKNNSLYKDSFWAVFGNGIGNFLMLLSGIIIARLLGKDLFGEYGMVKTTMFTMATFSTLAFANTTTKFIADYIQKDLSSVKSIIRSSILIVLLFSLSMCLLLFLLSDVIARFVNEPQLSASFKFLGILIVFRALNTLGAGLLGGFKDFRQVGIDNIIAGVTMFILCIPLTKLFNLSGAYISLLLSQACLCVLNIYFVYYHQKNIVSYSPQNYGKVLLVFSFPFAITEFIYTITAWGYSLALTKFSSLGELGMYTACLQWNAIIMFMPGLLGNVILSYLSTSASGSSFAHHQLIKRMLIVNLLSILFPLIIVGFSANYISQYYGKTFIGMDSIMRVAIWSTIFTCMSRVFDSNLMSKGRRWTASIICSFFYIMGLVAATLILYYTDGINAAMNLSRLSVITNALMLLVYMIEYRINYNVHLK